MRQAAAAGLPPHRTVSFAPLGCGGATFNAGAAAEGTGSTLAAHLRYRDNVTGNSTGLAPAGDQAYENRMLSPDAVPGPAG